VRAIDGMIEEQERFLLFYTLCTVTTIWALCGDFFAMMELPLSWTCSGILCGGLVYTGSSCMRIYNRFYFSNESDQIKAVNQVGMFNREYMNSFDEGPAVAAPMPNAISPVKPKDNKDSNGAGKSPQVAPQHSPFVDYDDDPTIESSLRYQYSSHISMKLGTGWQKLFFVIKGKYGLYYKDKKAFETAPMDPINNRPILLDEYVVDISIDTKNSILLLNLIPADPEDDRKIWEFRVDTELELQMWKTEFEKVCSVVTN
jgi:hypothetical protein